MSRMRALVPSLVLVACAHAPTTGGDPGSQAQVTAPRACPRSTASESGTNARGSGPSSYLALFDELAQKIEAHHVFADRPKADWPANKARLRTEFERASSRDEALVGLAHLQASLRDRHCQLSPPTDLRRTRLGLGVSLFTESVGGHPVVSIDEVLDPTLGSKLAERDEVVAVDGQPTERWLADHPFESNSLNDVVAAEERAGAIAWARLPWTSVKEGDVRTLRLRRAGTDRDVSLTFSRASRWEQAKGLSFDDAPSMSAIGCRNDRRADYTNFTLVAVGLNVCVYRPTTPLGALRESTRVVRFVSFDYGHSGDALRAAKADHALLKRTLGGASSVILDLHENHGGNNPFVFLSWFARKAWDHQTVHIRVSKDFSEDERRDFLWGDSALLAKYQKAIDTGISEETWPFLCQRDGQTRSDGTCEAEGPRPSELVTNAPVAVVTGPECTSSCDSFVSNWSTFKMGPLVGQQPAHGYTTVRHGYPLVGPDGRDLGLFRIALSWEGYPRSGTPLEGAPVQLDWVAPRTFETRHTWVERAVAEAAARAR